MASVTRRVLGVTFLAAMILVLAAGLQAQGQPQVLPGGYKWTMAAPFPEKMEELYGLEMDGKEWVLGGLGNGGVPPGLVYMYDPTADKWTKKANFPKPVHHQGQAIYKGK